MPAANPDFSAPSTFRFSALPWVALALAAVNALSVFLAVLVAVRESLVGGLLLMAFTLPLFGVLGGMTILGLSEIIISDHEITRRIFGKTWQSIQWNNVECIRVSPIPNFFGDSQQLH